MDTITKWRWFWAWDDEKEEAWLRAMANRGLHFRGFFFGRYEFEQGPARDDVYRLDFLPASRDRAEYLQIFQDAGWEYAGQFGSWQYFRKTAHPGEEAQIYTDNASKAVKYQRLIGVLVIFTPVWSILLTRMAERNEPVYATLTFLSFLLMVLYAYAMLRLIHRVSKLKKK